jgi:hypothetical protein
MLRSAALSIPHIPERAITSHSEPSTPTRYGTHDGAIEQASKSGFRVKHSF